METVIITVVWHPDFVEGKSISEEIDRRFHKLGMVRDGIGLSIPVRIRSTPLQSNDNSPRPINLDHAQTNMIVMLTEENLVRASQNEWKSYLENLAISIKSRGEQDALFNVALSSSGTSLEPFPEIQALRTFTWDKNLENTHWHTRLLLHLTNAIGYRLKLQSQIQKNPQIPADQVLIQKEQLFLSHAKKDGLEIAVSIRNYLNSQPFNVSTFMDAFDLPITRSYRGQFEATIKNSIFVVIQTDSYSTRPFCQWELLKAKEHNRPILILQKLERGEERAFPYAGNVPTRIFQNVTPSSIEKMLLEIMSETLRAMIWHYQATTSLDANGFKDFRIIIRPPELTDFSFQHSETLWVYPDPPIGDEERNHVDRLKGKISYQTLNELLNP